MNTDTEVNIPILSKEEVGKMTVEQKQIYIKHLMNMKQIADRMEKTLEDNDKDDIVTEETKKKLLTDMDAIMLNQLLLTTNLALNAMEEMNPLKLMLGK